MKFTDITYIRQNMDTFVTPLRKRKERRVRSFSAVCQVNKWAQFDV